jgi:hypothetical protein
MMRRDDATPVGATDTTARPWWQAGHGDASHLPTGTSRGRAPQIAASGVARWARVSAAEQQEDAVRPTGRLRPWDNAAAHGAPVVAAVRELASGVHAAQPPLGTRLATRQVGVPGGGARGGALGPAHPLGVRRPRHTPGAARAAGRGRLSNRHRRWRGRRRRGRRHHEGGAHRWPLHQDTPRRAARRAAPRTAGVAHVLPRDSEEA